MKVLLHTWDFVDGATQTIARAYLNVTAVEHFGFELRITQGEAQTTTIDANRILGALEITI